jgi:hypothetical protein
MTSYSLKRRITRLETQCDRAIPQPLILLVSFATQDKPPTQLDHHVVDIFRDTDQIAWARERPAITPADAGQCCERGGFLADALSEIHAHCPWNEKPGGCRLCAGTPIAGAAPTPVADNPKESR